MGSPPAIDPQLLDAAMALISDGLADTARRPLVLGLCGAQGSGKSTLAASIVDECAALGRTAAVLSIDDLYLGKAERMRLARDVHPLLATRGVPGTHDIALGLATLSALDDGEAAPLPRFDKAADDSIERALWPPAPAALDVLVFEGWCVGARPQPDADLAMPVNALEAAEDADGQWRAFVNAALAGPYQQLFARIDRLLLLAAPGFEVVLGWRRQQERELAHARPGMPGIMGETELTRFVSHYERITRHILREMPGRADRTVRLAQDRSVIAIA